ncbi:MAG: response regulator [Candidatus Komeilibacteria bacterium]|nr:response regulator [Candidatus Komeilibacteria bacterium]
MSNILIVEDDSFLAQMYANKLQFSDFTVLAAADGEKGLSMAKKQQPDLIVLDLILPKKDGFAVLADLKKDPTTQKIPVLILSNLSQRAEVDRCLALGAVDYLIKAHTIPSEVVNRIKEILQQK